MWYMFPGIGSFRKNGLWNNGHIFTLKPPPKTTSLITVFFFEQSSCLHFLKKFFNLLAKILKINPIFFYLLKQT
jgi:hypothetical protein